MRRKNNDFDSEYNFDEHKDREEDFGMDEEFDLESILRENFDEEPPEAPHSPKAEPARREEPAPRRRASRPAEDEEPAPRRRASRPAEDGEPAPRRRASRPAEDEEPAPRRRASRPAEDEEPAPRSKAPRERRSRRPEPEYGFEEEPRPKMKKGKKAGLIILIVVVVLVAALVIAGISVFMHMYNQMDTSSAGKKPDTTAVPADTTPLPTMVPTSTPVPTPTPVPLTEEELEALRLEQEKQELEASLQQEAVELVYDEDVYNILLLGSDSRELSDDSRTDSMMLVSINKRTEELWLTSIQRDAYVDIPGWGSAKLNAANVYGGVDLLKETIEQAYGIKIDNYAMVNFLSFMDLAEMAGGITVTMTADQIYYMNLAIIEGNTILQAQGQDIDSNDGIIWDLVDGTYHLNGKQTLGYCRIRALDGDTKRSERQRDAVTQMIGNVKNMSLMEMYKFAEKAMSMVSTDLTPGQCASLLLTAPSLLSYDMHAHQVPVKGAYFGTMINEQSVYRVDFNVNRAYLRATVYGQDVPENELTSYITGNYALVYAPPAE